MRNESGILDALRLVSVCFALSAKGGALEWKTTHTANMRNTLLNGAMLDVLSPFAHEHVNANANAFFDFAQAVGQIKLSHSH